MFGVFTIMFFLLVVGGIAFKNNIVILISIVGAATCGTVFYAIKKEGPIKAL